MGGGIHRAGMFDSSLSESWELGEGGIGWAPVKQNRGLSGF